MAEKDLGRMFLVGELAALYMRDVSKPWLNKRELYVLSFPARGGGRAKSGWG